MPHQLIQDDWYDGYFLPKDTIVFTCVFSVHHDESEYDRPDKFIPERWLDNEYGTKTIGSSTDNEKRPKTYAFGTGRRVCPGQHMGENSLVSLG